MPLQLNGPGDLHELAGQRAGMQTEAHSRHLHGDGRGAHRPTLAPVARPQGAQQRSGVDAGMPVEVPVFIQERRLNGGGADRVEAAAQPVALVVGQREPQQAPLAIQHGGRERRIAVQRRFWAQGEGQPPRDRQTQAAKPYRAPQAHRAERTSKRAGLLRARTLRSYIDPANAEGTAKSPALVSLAR